jgi:hypothetical protein
MSRHAAPIHVSETINVGDKHDGVSPEFLNSPDLRHGKVGLHLYEDRMLLPFEVPQEALLFHHYMEQLAALVRHNPNLPPIFKDMVISRSAANYNLQLDITDIQRHFAVDVPERAPSCPVLLNALMAFAGRHLSRTSDFDSTVADHYRHECVSLMIPMLDEKELVADETLFAAAVILRALEETNGANASSPLAFSTCTPSTLADLSTIRIANGSRA